MHIQGWLCAAPGNCANAWCQHRTLCESQGLYGCELRPAGSEVESGGLCAGHGGKRSFDYRGVQQTLNCVALLKGISPAEVGPVGASIIGCVK